MNDTRTTNILLIALILLLAAFTFRPALDGASSAQAYDPAENRDIISRDITAQADATRAIADANREIAQAIKGLGDKIEDAAEKISSAMSANTPPAE